MNKRERLFSMLQGNPVDRTPVGFWLHFPPEMHHGDAAVKAHLDFMKQTDTDILKIMNENVFHDGETKIYSTADIKKFRGFTKADTLFKDQMQIIRSISDKAHGEYPIISTIHGLVTSTFHETGFAGNYSSMGYGLAIFCRERPREMMNVLKMIAESLMELVDCSLEAGADGIFYAALGGERNFFTDEEFETFILPYEKMIYEYINRRTKLNVLHICKENIALERFSCLKPSIVNWGVYPNKISLTQGAGLFPDSILLGGFPDRQGVLVSGDTEAIRRHTKAVLAERKDTPFIIGADCTLPTNIDPKRIRTVVETVREAADCAE